MSGEFLVLKREDLFARVWQQPMTKLAKEFGVSDVGLRKICKKLKIPLPPQGYWAKKYRQKPPLLPATQGPTSHTIRVLEPQAENSPEEQGYIDPRSSNLIDYESNPKHKIEVAKHLRKPHPLVEATRTALQAGKPDDYGRLYSWRKGCLGVGIGQGSVNRVLLILDALVKALEKRGYRVTSSDGNAEVTVLDEKLTFTIEEPAKRFENVVTPEQRKKDPYLYYHKYRYVPTGNLVLKIDKLYYGAWKSWKDDKARKIEDCLNEFMVGLVEVAEAKMRQRLERQREEEKRRRAREEREAREREIEAESARRQALEQEAANWAKARQIRRYVAAVKERALRNRESLEPESELGRWVDWALAYCRLLDPLLRDAASDERGDPR